MRVADRRVAAVVQRVVGQPALADVRPAVVVAPVGERVRLPQLVRRVPAELRRVRARRRLVAADAGDPGVEAAERPDERLDLGDREVEVGLALPELLAVLRGELLGGSAPRTPRPSCRSAARPRARARTSPGRGSACRSRRRAPSARCRRACRAARSPPSGRSTRARPCPGTARRRSGATSSALIASTAAASGSVNVLRCVGSPRSTSFSVSPRRPRRSVSSGITSSGGMLPRLTDGPNCLMNHAWAAFVGASKMMFAGPTTFAISPISSVRMPPDESKMPAVPPSRASVITFQAPAASSSFSHVVHSSTVYSTDESFEPTSESTVKSRAKSAISSSLRSRGMSIVPSEISTCVRPSSLSHCLYSSSLSFA